MLQSLYQSITSAASDSHIEMQDSILQRKLPAPQPQSSFLTKLPIEIRRTIYEHVFGHSIIHLLDMGQRLAHLRCEEESRDGHRHGVEGLDGCPILDKEEYPNDRLLALCKTCSLV